MNKEFTKDMLKDGDKLTLRNGGSYIYDSGEFMYENDDINNDLTDTINGKGFDIVKVERIQVPDIEAFAKLEYISANGYYKQEQQLFYKHNKERINNNLTYQTIWERDLTNLLQNNDECVDLSKQPKKIEPIIQAAIDELYFMISKVEMQDKYLSQERTNYYKIIKILEENQRNSGGAE